MVTGANKPTKRVKRKFLTTKSPILHYVRDEEGKVFTMYHAGVMKAGRKIRCMVNGFNPNKTPKLVLSRSEYPNNDRPRPIETQTSAHLRYTPMGNKK